MSRYPNLDRLADKGPIRVGPCNGHAEEVARPAAPLGKKTQRAGAALMGEVPPAARTSDEEVADTRRRVFGTKRAALTMLAMQPEGLTRSHALGLTGWASVSPRRLSVPKGHEFLSVRTNGQTTYFIRPAVPAPGVEQDDKPLSRAEQVADVCQRALELVGPEEVTAILRAVMARENDALALQFFSLALELLDQGDVPTLKTIARFAR